MQFQGLWGGRGFCSFHALSRKTIDYASWKGRGIVAAADCARWPNTPLFFRKRLLKVLDKAIYSFANVVVVVLSQSPDFSKTFLNVSRFAL